MRYFERISQNRDLSHATLCPVSGAEITVIEKRAIVNNEITTGHGGQKEQEQVLVKERLINGKTKEWWNYEYDVKRGRIKDTRPKEPEQKFDWKLFKELEAKFDAVRAQQRADHAARVQALKESTTWDETWQRLRVKNAKIGNSISGGSDPLNRTSHKVLTQATRMDAEGNKIEVWQTPSVVTQPVYDEHGNETRVKVKTITVPGRVIVSGQTRETGKYGELDEVHIPEPDDTAVKEPMSVHAGYMAEKKHRESGLDTVYSRYCEGKVRFEFVFRHLQSFINWKASTQYSIKNIRREATKDATDYALELFQSLWPKAEAKKVEGPLSFYVNRSFKRKFQKAQKAISKEYARRRQAAVQPDYEEPIETLTDYVETPAPKLSVIDYPVLPADENTASAVNIPASDIPAIRIQQKALNQYWDQHTGIKRRVIDLLCEGLNQKEIAVRLDTSEATVCRLRKRIEEELVKTGGAL